MASLAHRSARGLNFDLADLDGGILSPLGRVGEHGTRRDARRRARLVAPRNGIPQVSRRRFTIAERCRAAVREYSAVMEKAFIGRDGVRRAPVFGSTNPATPT